MRTRIDLAEWLPKGAIAAEIGVFKGEFSAELIARTSPREFYLVDLFDGEFTSGGVDGFHVETADLREVKKSLELLYSDRPHIKVVQDDSIRWLKSLPKDYLDWIYLDSSHSYEMTNDELEAAGVAVRPDGYIAGHDYHEDFAHKRSVDEFVLRYGLSLEVWAGDRYPSFCITNRRA